MLLKPTQTGAQTGVDASSMTQPGFGWDVPQASVPVGPQTMPQPQFDPDLGQIFLRMRTLLGLSLWDMARMVGGEPPVIANLEAGALGALPPWPELARLVDAYARLTGIDPQPILSRLLRAQPAGAGPMPMPPGPRTITVTGPRPAAGDLYARSAPASGYDPAPAIAPGPPSSGGGAPRDRRAPPSVRSYVNAPALATQAEVVTKPTSLTSHGVRAATSIGRGLSRIVRQRMLAVLGLLVFPATLLVVARLFPLVLYFLASVMPTVVGRPLLMGIDQLVAAMAPVRDGLTWIDIGDPRLRKSARLPERSRQ